LKRSASRIKFANFSRHFIVLSRAQRFPMSGEGKVYKDDDGNLISKNAYKKLQKRKKTAAAKAKKAANKPKKKVKEDDLDPSQYHEMRMRMVKERIEKNDNPYPHKFEVTISIPEFVERYKHLEKQQVEDVEVTIAGRIYAERRSGKKLIFYDIKADGTGVQVLCSQANVEAGAIPFADQHVHVRRGDIVGFRGKPMRSRAGELSLQCVEAHLLSPCLHNLPSEKYPIKSQETRYRQRYLDLIITPKTREIFCVRSQIINYIRRYLDSRGFLEVETPILNQIPSGAAARPFLTKHNELDLPMYLRIAPELFLKMLLVGGLDRVYEIGRLFRNEGIDPTHNPEFTTCEFYWAYKDYNDLMDVTEEMISEMVYQIKGTYVVEFTRINEQTKKEETIEINFERPWQRFEMIPELESRGKMKIPFPYDSDECKNFLAAKCEEFEIQVSEPKTVSRMLDKLTEHFLEPECQNPAFIMNHPQIMSPLAKYHRSLPGLTERFECFVAGKEICNAYTELNNPIKQEETFMSQSKDAASGDDEAMPFDRGYVTALEHGLPPCAGWGMGVDRLTMFLTNSSNIKEVMLFPQMKPMEADAAALKQNARKHFPDGKPWFQEESSV